jgi:NADPH:quinone reductase-like Zn-dependent oxidoreductase
VLQGDNLRNDIDKALGGKKLSLVLDSLGGSPVGELARSLKPGCSIAVYAFKLGLPVLSPEFLYNNLSLHGFWVGNWMRNAPSTEIQELTERSCSNSTLLILSTKEKNEALTLWFEY